jgi:uncharacterized protein (TIGR02231 family)
MISISSPDHLIGIISPNIMEFKIDEQSNTRFHEICAKDCRNTSVTVYQDRAEVVRIISLPLACTGEHTVLLHTLTNETNPESIRVKGFLGCEILEVSHEMIRKSTTNPDAGDGVIDSLKNQINQFKKEQKSLNQSIALISKERKLIQTYADDAMTRGKEQSPLSLSDARELIAFHSSEMVRLDEKESGLCEETTQLNEKLESAKRDLSKLIAAGSSAQSHDRFSSSYSVSIVLDIGTDVTLSPDALDIQFSYVVCNATWSPSYDLRINSISNELSLSYFAEVYRVYLHTCSCVLQNVDVKHTDD